MDPPFRGRGQDREISDPRTALAKSLDDPKALEKDKESLMSESALFLLQIFPFSSLVS